MQLEHYGAYENEARVYNVGIQLLHAHRDDIKNFLVICCDRPG